MRKYLIDDSLEPDGALLHCAVGVGLIGAAATDLVKIYPPELVRYLQRDGRTVGETRIADTTKLDLIAAIARDRKSAQPIAVAPAAATRPASAPTSRNSAICAD